MTIPLEFPLLCDDSERLRRRHRRARLLLRLVPSNDDDDGTIPHVSIVQDTPTWFSLNVTQFSGRVVVMKKQYDDDDDEDAVAQKQEDNISQQEIVAKIHAESMPAQEQGDKPPGKMLWHALQGDNSEHEVEFVKEYDPDSASSSLFSSDIDNKAPSNLHLKEKEHQRHQETDGAVSMTDNLESLDEQAGCKYDGTREIGCGHEGEKVFKGGQTGVESTKLHKISTESGFKERSSPHAFDDSKNDDLDDASFANGISSEIRAEVCSSSLVAESTLLESEHDSEEESSLADASIVEDVEGCCNKEDQHGEKSELVKSVETEKSIPDPIPLSDHYIAGTPSHLADKIRRAPRPSASWAGQSIFSDSINSGILDRTKTALQNLSFGGQQQCPIPSAATEQRKNDRDQGDDAVLRSAISAWQRSMGNNKSTSMHSKGDGSGNSEQEISSTSASNRQSLFSSVLAVTASLASKAKRAGGASKVQKGSRKTRSGNSSRSRLIVCDAPTRLHELCQKPDVMLGELQEELEHHPEAVKIKDDRGRLPLHILGDNDDLVSNLLGKVAATTFATQLIHAYPESVVQKDSEGWMPFVRMIYDWHAWIYEEHVKAKQSSQASNAANRLLGAFVDDLRGIEERDNREDVSTVSSNARLVNVSSRSFPQIDIWDEVIWCFEMLSVAMDELGGKHGSSHRPSRRSLLNPHGNNDAGRAELVTHLATAIPTLLKTILMLEDEGGETRRKLLKMSVIRRLLLAPEHVGPWLTTMLRTQGLPAKRAIDYLVLISNVTPLDYVGEFRSILNADHVAFRAQRDDVIQAIECLDGTIASLVVLSEREIERAAATHVVWEIMCMNLARPFVVSLVLVDFVLHITLLFVSLFSLIFLTASDFFLTLLCFFLCLRPFEMMFRFGLTINLRLERFRHKSFSSYAVTI